MSTGLDLPLAGAAVGAAASGGPFGNIYYVSGSDGDDSKATKGIDGLPYENYHTALDLSASGDAILVAPGTYTMPDDKPGIAKDGVTLIGYGVTFQYTTTGGAEVAGAFIDDTTNGTNGDLIFAVKGKFKFIRNGTAVGSPIDNGCVALENNNTVITLNGDIEFETDHTGIDMRTGSPKLFGDITSITAGFAATFIADSSTIYLKLKEITNNDSFWSFYAEDTARATYECDMASFGGDMASGHGTDAELFCFVKRAIHNSTGDGFMVDSNSGADMLLRIDVGQFEGVKVIGGSVSHRIFIEFDRAICTGEGITLSEGGKGFVRGKYFETDGFPICTVSDGELDIECDEYKVLDTPTNNPNMFNFTAAAGNNYLTVRERNLTGSGSVLNKSGASNLYKHDYQGVL